MAFPRIHHFSQCNPLGDGQDDVPAVLRRVAASIEELGPVTVQDLTFANEVNEHGLWPQLTVYFHYGALEEPCTCGDCRDTTGAS